MSVSVSIFETVPSGELEIQMNENSMSPKPHSVSTPVSGSPVVVSVPPVVPPVVSITPLVVPPVVPALVVVAPVTPVVVSPVVVVDGAVVLPVIASVAPPPVSVMPTMPVVGDVLVVGVVPAVVGSSVAEAVGDCVVPAVSEVVGVLLLSPQADSASGTAREVRRTRRIAAVYPNHLQRRQGNPRNDEANTLASLTSRHETARPATVKQDPQTRERHAHRGRRGPTAATTLAITVPAKPAAPLPPIVNASHGLAALLREFGKHEGNAGVVAIKSAEYFQGCKDAPTPAAKLRCLADSAPAPPSASSPRQDLRPAK